MKTRNWLLFGIGAFAIFLVLSLPAEHAFKLAAKRFSPPAALVGIEGTWHHGSAAAGRIGGFCLEELQWSLEPLALLAGRLQVKVRAFLPEGEGHAEGQLAASWGGAMVRNLSLELPVEQLAPFWSRYGFRLAGQATAAMQRLEIGAGRLKAAEGTIVWRQASLRAPQHLFLGDLRAELQTEDDRITAVISDNGGPLAVNGLLTLAPDATWTLTGTAGVREGSDPELASYLRLLGRPGPDGRVAVSWSGDLVK